MTDPARGPLAAAARLIVIGALAGCGPFAEPGKGPVVLSLEGQSVTLEDLRLEYDVRNGSGAFDALPLAQKQSFLETIGDKEVLLRKAREASERLEPPYDRFVREARDEHLMRAFESQLRAPIERDTATTRMLLEKLNKQLRISWIVTHSDSTAQLARDMVAGGGSFADQARKYCEADSIRKIGGHIGWVTADLMGPVFVEELFLTEREPGYLSQVQATPRGFEIIYVHESRPFDMRARPPKIYESLPGVITGIRFRQRVSTWIDSVEAARGLTIHDEALPVMRRRMKAFWDSLDAHGRDAPKVAETYGPPFHVFKDAELSQAVYDLDGKAVSIREFLEALRQVPMTIWPFGLSDKAMRHQILRWMGFTLQLEAARALGLDRDPFVQAQDRMSEEKFWIERFHKKVIEPTIKVQREDAQLYYEQNRESYKQGDKFRFSYVVFPGRDEADRFHRSASRGDGRWWSERLDEFLRRPRGELTVVASSQEFDLSKPIPAEVRGLVDEGRDRSVNEILRPVPFSGGRWAVGRILDREKPGYLPFERVERAILRRLVEQRVTEKIDAVVKEGRETYRLRLHPERLGARG